MYFVWKTYLPMTGAWWSAQNVDLERFSLFSQVASGKALRELVTLIFSPLCLPTLGVKRCNWGSQVTHEFIQASLRARYLEVQSRQEQLVAGFALCTRVGGPGRRTAGFSRLPRREASKQQEGVAADSKPTSVPLYQPVDLMRVDRRVATQRLPVY